MKMRISISTCSAGHTCLRTMWKTGKLPYTSSREIYRKEEGDIKHAAYCNNCAEEEYIRGTRYVCRSCEDGDLCSDRYKLYDEGKLSFPFCKGHTFLAVPRNDWATLAPGTVLADGMRVKQWLQRQSRRWTPRLVRFSQMLGIWASQL